MSTDQSNDANLIGYLLDALEEPTRAQVLAQLDADPELCQRLESLRAALEPLEADKEEVRSPADLAVKTMARVAEFCCRELPRAPVPVSSGGGTRNWWRRVDVIVAACLGLTTLGLLLPALFLLRGPRSAAAKTECQNNLRVFFIALDAFRANQGKFPNLAAAEPHHVAGMVIPMLAQSGVLPENFSLHCPGTGPQAGCSMTTDQAKSLNPDSFCKNANFLAYAYSLGFKDADGRYFGPVQLDNQPAHLIALMADAPPHCLKEGNSPNHAGAGQNVLFFDGSVRFTPIRTIGYQGDDIYLNKNNRVAAGLDSLDIVLGNGSAKP